MSLLLSLNIFYTLCTIAKFEHVNADWVISSCLWRVKIKENRKSFWNSLKGIGSGPFSLSVSLSLCLSLSLSVSLCLSLSLSLSFSLFSLSVSAKISRRKTWAKNHYFIDCDKLDLVLWNVISETIFLLTATSSPSYFFPIRGRQRIPLGAKLYILLLFMTIRFSIIITIFIRISIP